MNPSITRALIEECRDALAEELAAYDIDPPLHHIKQAHAHCVDWLAEFDALAQPAQAAPSDVERDAARYRWLRTWVKRDVDTQAVVPMTGTFQATALSLDELDAAIDTAMLAAAPEVKP